MCLKNFYVKNHATAAELRLRPRLRLKVSAAGRGLFICFILFIEYYYFTGIYLFYLLFLINIFEYIMLIDNNENSP